MSINEFLKAHFLDASERYNEIFVVSAKSDVLTVAANGGTGKGWVELRLRLGPVAKRVRLEDHVPVDLAQLRDLIWRIAGPATWSAP